MRLIFSLLFLFLFLGCADKITINGLMCPSDDQAVIKNDLQECHVYDLDAIDKAIQNKECKKCLEQKGYIVDANATK